MHSNQWNMIKLDKINKVKLLVPIVPITYYSELLLYASIDRTLFTLNAAMHYIFLCFLKYSIFCVPGKGCSIFLIATLEYRLLFQATDVDYLYHLIPKIFLYKTLLL